MGSIYYNSYQKWDYLLHLNNGQTGKISWFLQQHEHRLKHYGISFFCWISNYKFWVIYDFLIPVIIFLKYLVYIHKKSITLKSIWYSNERCFNTLLEISLLRDNNFPQNKRKLNLIPMVSILVVYSWEKNLMTNLYI